MSIEISKAPIYFAQPSLGRSEGTAPLKLSPQDGAVAGLMWSFCQLPHCLLPTFASSQVLGKNSMDCIQEFRGCPEVQDSKERVAQRHVDLFSDIHMRPLDPRLSSPRPLSILAASPRKRATHISCDQRHILIWECWGVDEVSG